MSDTQPRLKVAFANLGKSNGSPVLGEDDGFEDEMVMPEAFTQLSVGSPGNSYTGMIFTPTHILPKVLSLRR